MRGGGLLTFALGCFVGAVAAYGYFSNKYATDPVKDKDKNKLPESQQNQGGNSPQTGQTAVSNAEVKEMEQKGEIVPDDKVPENVVTTNMNDIQKYSDSIIDYTSFSQPPKRDPGEVMYEERHKRPEVITYDEFGRGPEGVERETSTLLYFVDEGVLTNENHEIVDNPDTFVGNTLDAFDQEDAPVMFVRNYLLGIDYMVQKTAGGIL